MRVVDLEIIGERRQRADLYLFGEQGVETLLDPRKIARPAVVAFARDTDLVIGGFDRTLTAYLDHIPGLVVDILDEEDALARNENASLFAFRDDYDKALVADIASRIVRRWELTAVRNNIPSVAFFEQEVDGADITGRDFVLAVSLGVMHCVASIDRANPNSKTFQRAIFQLISNFGPNFTRTWLDGTFISSWVERNIENLEDREAIVKLFSPGFRTNLAANYQGSLLDRFESIVHNYMLLDPEKVAKELQMEIDDARVYLTPSIRRILSRTHLHDCLGVLKNKFKQLEIYSTEYPEILPKLIWNTIVFRPRRVESLLPQVASIVVPPEYPSNTWQRAMIASFFNESMARELIRNIRLMQRISYRSSPRRKSYSGYRKSKPVTARRPVSLDSKIRRDGLGSISLADVIADPSSLDPLENMLLDEGRLDQIKVIQSLAKKADVTNEELRLLLASMDDEEPSSPFLNSVLIKLQIAADDGCS